MVQLHLALWNVNPGAKHHPPAWAQHLGAVQGGPQQAALGFPSFDRVRSRAFEGGVPARPLPPCRSCGRTVPPSGRIPSCRPRSWPDVPPLRRDAREEERFTPSLAWVR